MSDSARKLLYYNSFSALSDLLAVEDHLEDLDKEDIAHSWCAQKHSMRAFSHHMKEFENHCVRDPECREKVLDKFKDFKKRFGKEIIEPMSERGEPLELLKVVRFRNELRSLIGVLFPDLAKIDSTCPICELDNEGQMKWLEKEAKKGEVSA